MTTESNEPKPTEDDSARARQRRASTLTDQDRSDIEHDLRVMLLAQGLVEQTARGCKRGTEFLQIAGLIASYRDMATTALKQGRDYVGEQNLTKIDPEQADYAGEKIGRLFGGWCLRQTVDVRAAFLHAAGIVNLPAQRAALRRARADVHEARELLAVPNSRESAREALDRADGWLALLLGEGNKPGES